MEHAGDQAIRVCARCARLLLDDPDDDPSGGPDGLPLCGECARERDFDADQAWLDQEDGEMDGVVEW